MDKGERLTQFLEWVEARRASSLATSDMRGVASALLEESGGGRVTESHILAVGDRFAVSGGEHALVMVTECGELFLRFEEWQRQAGMPSAAPRGPLGTLAPRRHSTPEPASAPADVSPPLRPPERVPTEGEPVLPRSPVTFSRTTSSSLPLPSPRDTQEVKRPQPTGPVPRAEPPGPEPDVHMSQRITGARAPAAQPLPEPDVRESQRVPGPRDSQRLAGAFRCPRCAVMVFPGPDGTCPKCGGPPPHLLAMPLPSAPSRSQPVDGKGINWLVPIALLLAGVVGTAMGVKWSRTACDQNRGQSVAGQARIERLHVKVFFPAGWRQYKGVDEIAPVATVTGKMLGYYKGGTSDDPDIGLMLMVTDNLPTPPGALQAIADADFRQLLDATASSMSASGAQLQPCEITQIGLRRTGRCTGEGSDRGKQRRVALYAWTMDRRLGVAFFFAKEPIDKVLAQTDDIVGSVEAL